MAGDDYKVRLSSLLRVLREIQEESTVSINDIKEAKSIAANLYFEHSNRKITLNENEFNLIVSILELKS